MSTRVLIKCYCFIHGETWENKRASCSKFKRNVKEGVVHLRSCFGPARRRQLHTQGDWHKNSCKFQPVPPSSTKMVLLPSLLLILACLSGSFGQQDLKKKVFVFPSAAKKAMVQVNVSFPQPLTNVTVCLRFNSLQARPYTPFSYSSKPRCRDLQITIQNPSQLNIQIGGMTQIIPLRKASSLGWQHICMSWNSTSGLVHFWHDGELYPRFVMRKGYKIKEMGTIFLGQDCDSWGRRDGFVGEMADVYVWPRVLTPDEIHLVKKNDEVANSVVNWHALNYTLEGDVSVEEALH